MKTKPLLLFWTMLATVSCGLSLRVVAGPAFIYWSESTRNPSVVSSRIMRVNLGGSVPSVVHSLADFNSAAHDVEIDPGASVLYWNQPSTSTLFKTDLSNPGSAPVSVHFFPGGIANGFHFDALSQSFYVVDGAAA